MSGSEQIRIAFITVETNEEAKRIASSLLNAHLVACVNILPAHESMYHWQGSIESSNEHLLILKTQADHEAAIIDAVQSLHSYDVPEIIFLPVSNGLPQYLSWVVEETQKH